MQPRSRGRLILESWSRGRRADLIELVVAVELPELELPGGDQTVQQEQRAVLRRQHRLRLDPPAELLDHALDDVRGPQPLPLALGEAVERQQLRTRLLEALDHCRAQLLSLGGEPQPRAPRRSLVLGIDDLAIILPQLHVQALGGMRFQIAQLVFRNVHKQEMDFMRGYMVHFSAGRGNAYPTGDKPELGGEFKDSLTEAGGWGVFMMMQGETIPKETNHVRLSTDKKAPKMVRKLESRESQEFKKNTRSQ